MKLTLLGKATATALCCLTLWGVTAELAGGDHAAPSAPPPQTTVSAIEITVPSAGTVRFRDATGAGLLVEQDPTTGQARVRWGDGWELTVSGPGCGMIPAILRAPDGELVAANVISGQSYTLRTTGLGELDRSHDWYGYYDDPEAWIGTAGK